MCQNSAKNSKFLQKVSESSHHAAVISIKHVKSFVSKDQISYTNKTIFNLFDKWPCVFYGYNGSMGRHKKSIQFFWLYLFWMFI